MVQHQVFCNLHVNLKCKCYYYCSNTLAGQRTWKNLETSKFVNEIFQYFFLTCFHFKAMVFADKRRHFNWDNKSVDLCIMPDLDNCCMDMEAWVCCVISFHTSRVSLCLLMLCCLSSLLMLGEPETIIGDIYNVYDC